MTIIAIPTQSMDAPILTSVSETLMQAQLLESKGEYQSALELVNAEVAKVVDRFTRMSAYEW